MNTRLLSRFGEDIQLRGLAESTGQAYERNLCRYAQYIKVPLSKTGPEHPRKYLKHLNKQNLTASTLNQHAAALKFFYHVTLGKKWALDRIVTARQPKKLPTVLSGSEVVRVTKGFSSQMQMTVALVCYGAGLRVSEAIRLHPEDIDSKRGVIVVRDGKGQKDRQVTLTPRLLTSLRKYYTARRPERPYLFPGRDKGRHITKAAFGKALKKATSRSGVKKRVTPHTLRHCYACHMIEAGADLRTVQLLLGHASIQSTAHYVQLTHARMQKLGSPLELLGTPQGRFLG